ncbi:Armadillo-type fold [Artemisia annua]|uniref:Armadillo-type fold n=1 Tax=Artemisia annua TaxID=35608 RepID=A0A2U1LXZ3_ARTAN|nr:Armadillo-type fold [Artemisia annua]
MNEVELEPRVKPLTYKIKATSRESPSQKSSHILDIDLRNHWSTATNTKEWILLELDEPCLLSHIRIYNKSVLEWEISVGLRYKPETFLRVRPRCEAPRRDMMYPMNYTACRYVRLSCLRGNPIAIFFIQLIGVPVTGLEPEFQPVINHLLPHITSHKQDAEDIHLQADLNSFADASEPTLRFLAMLAGPFYPILHILNERENAKSAGNVLDSEASKNSLSTPVLTVSSNFEPRRSRNTVSTFSHTSTSTVFRADAILMLLRKAYKDSHLGTVCRTVITGLCSTFMRGKSDKNSIASRVLRKLEHPNMMHEASISTSDVSTDNDEDPNSKSLSALQTTDYSNLFGEEFRITDDHWDFTYLQLLDIKAVEEGILHVLFACASQPLLCSKLAENSSEFWSTLPLIQALLPALRPNFSNSSQVDDSFSAWRQPIVQQALSQAKAACVLIDLCTGVLGPWMGQVDLAVELIEDLLGVIHGAHNAMSNARVALKYIVLALSGHMDDVMAKYKDVKHQILFLLEILEPFLDPALAPLKSLIAFGNVSQIFPDSQEQNCTVALNVIRKAVTKSAILPSLESEWRRGSVAPIVLLSILEPHMQLPPSVALGKSATSEAVDPQLADTSAYGAVASKIIDRNDTDEQADATDTMAKLETFDDVNVLFAPPKVKDMGHNAAVDALLLAAECYVNPFFMMSFRDSFKLFLEQKIGKTNDSFGFAEIKRILEKSDGNLETLARLEKERDKIVLELLLKAAELDCKFQKMVPNSEKYSVVSEANDDYMQIYAPDTSSMDAITLVRQNQALLCSFLINSLLNKQHSMREILLQSLVFLLQSATKLYCPPEHIIDIILESAEYLYELLVSYCHQSKEGTLRLELIKVHEVERYWTLIQRLVAASSGGEESSSILSNMSKGARFSNLVPSSAWMKKISSFSSSASPLVRFVGWMAVARNSKQYQKERLILTSDLSQLTTLLSVFADELAVVDDIAEQKDVKSQLAGQQRDLSLRVIYPEISHFFPNLKKQFKAFGETILEAVGLQLRVLPSSVVPDLLCWFSDFCSWPLLQKEDDTILSSKSSSLFKGFLAKNAKAIILYVLEAIVREHMEAMVPEIPRVMQVLESLCKTSYCDVAFLDSVLGLLKPLISYSLRRASNAEHLVVGDSCLDFESLCFNELFSNIRDHSVNQGKTSEQRYSRAPTILVLASVFLDLSIQRKREILQLLVYWADFANFEPTTSFYDYLWAFQVVMESCKTLLVERLQVLGVIPIKLGPSLKDNGASCDYRSNSHSLFLVEACKGCEHLQSDTQDTSVLNQKNRHLSVEEIAEFSKELEGLVSKLNPTIELCWKLHYQPAKKLTVTLAQCFVYLRCLLSVLEKDSTIVTEEKEDPVSPSLVDNLHWITGLEQLADIVLSLLENSCWEVASTILDCILESPCFFSLEKLISPLCSAMKKFSQNAPKVSWRLQTNKWLSSLLNGGSQCLQESQLPLVDLLCSMMGHVEPEQRFVALKHLGKLVGQEADSEVIIEQDNSCGESFISSIVIKTWDQIVVLASSDMSPLLRMHSLALLVKCVPFAERPQLQSVLGAADSFLPCLVNLGQQTCEDPFMNLSLALIVTICLYCPAEDVSLIPERIWSNIETLGQSEAGNHEGLVQSACKALCKLKVEGDEAKEILKGVLASNYSKQDSDFESTRESLLQVLANLTSVQSYFDFFSKKTDEKLMTIDGLDMSQEIEEAEIEMDLLHKEQSVQDSSNDFTDWRKLPFLASYEKEDKRLQEIKDEIQSLEKAKLKEEIVARRQKKLLIRRARQKYLEETALHEAELLQELDREKAAEMENEIERQKLLAAERAKTRELQHNLEMEKEKKTQDRELQRELEQTESGLRPGSRREFSSTGSSRPRDRYRERDNGRPTNEGTLRTSGSGDFTNPSSSMASTPNVVIPGQRQFSGQQTTLLQSRDRPDDGGSGYEENIDGSRDSGDTGSVGEPDLMMAFEGQSGNFGPGQRHGSRGNKPRQVMDRRERDTRREGKWERRH